MTLSFLKSFKVKVLLTGGLAVLLVAIFFTFFFRYQIIKYSQARALLGTFVQIHICATRADKSVVLNAFDKAWSRLSEINERMNVYDEKSDIAKINHSYPNSVKVHSDVYQILALSKKYCELTRGAFDITIWPLVVLWKEAQIKQQRPSPQEIKGAQETIGVDKIKLLADDSVQLTHPQTKIDLSAIGQGYAADEAAALLKREGMKHFLVDAGGEVFAQGLNERGRPWSIGIRDPRQGENMIDVVHLTHQGVSTSGDYEKYYVINQKKYSHIINPITGYPSDRVVSATVIAPNATQADIFSTALCVLGKEGIKFIESLSPEVSIVVMEQNPDQTISIYKNNAYQNMSR
jgi:thiamine biosynthesis lipoprotein